MSKRSSGVDWQAIERNQLPEPQRKLFDAYQTAIEKAKKIGQQLKDNLNEEWQAQNPDALAQARFNVINGSVLVMMKEGKLKPKRFNPFFPNN